MSKPKLLLISYRAFGDHLFWSFLIPILTKEYDVYLETNTKGMQLFSDDPRFKQIAYFKEVDRTMTNEERTVVFEERWQKLREQVKPDKEINLNGTIEVECIAENFQEEFYWPVADRRAYFGQTSFFDAILNRTGIKMPDTFELNGMYFTPEQTAIVEKWREKNKDNFVVIIPIAGTTAQKVFHNYKEVALAILNKYEDAIVYLAGDKECRAYMIDHPRIRPLFGDDTSIKQSIQMAQYADMVIGGETSLLAAAGIAGTPKITLATTTSVYQLTKFQKNDFSIQAPIYCSPCHRSIYFRGDCENELVSERNEFQGVACSKMFRVDDIMSRVDYVYHNLRYNLRNSNAQIAEPI